MFQIKCRKCNCCVDNRRDLFAHQKIHHSQIGYGDLQRMPFDHTDVPWMMDDGSIDVEMKIEYDLNIDLILHKSEEGEYIYIYIYVFKKLLFKAKCCEH